MTTLYNFLRAVFGFGPLIGSASINREQSPSSLTTEQQNSEPTQMEPTTDIPVTVTSTTLQTSSRSDDTTIQDALISPDSDSSTSTNISTGCIHRPENGCARTDFSRSSCSNSIVSSDSLVSDTLDSKSFTVKNSESEIGKHRFRTGRLCK